MRICRSIFSWSLSPAMILVATLSLGLAGCATTKEVTAIVNQSNAALMGGSLEQANNVTQTVDLADAISRIDAFIEQNAGNPGITAPLRLRQAMLFTVHQRSNLAEATWELVPRENLHTDRDRALYDLWPQLVWWFAKSENALARDDLGDAEAALQRFTEVCDKLDTKSDTRAYLEEMRAWIALAIGRDSSGGRVETVLIDGLERYMSIFDEDDINGNAPGAALKMLSNQEKREGELVGPLRRRLRAITVLQQYRSVAQEQRVSPDWKPDWVAALMPNLPRLPEE